MNELSQLRQEVPQWGIMVFAMSEEKPLKQLRLNLGLSQKQAADYLGIPLNTLQNYEQGQRMPADYLESLLLDRLSAYPQSLRILFTPKKGIYPFSLLQKKIVGVLKGYPVEAAYLFGSYAKGLAQERSDVDLYIVSSLNGLSFFGLRASLEEALHKDVDLLSSQNVTGGSTIEKEIQKTGIRIL
jgi:predicted nucleotidyltransferase/DNA-binding XRE family transcriptional regulator